VRFGGARLGLAGFIAVVALTCGVEVASSDGSTPSADIVGSLSGPSSGKLGDTFTFTVTATDRGPDAGQVAVWFAMEKGRGLTLLDSTPACPVLETPDQFIVQCGASE
jgi:hypothetical protein